VRWMRVQLLLGRSKQQGLERPGGHAQRTGICGPPWPGGSYEKTGTVSDARVGRLSAWRIDKRAPKD